MNFLKEMIGVPCLNTSTGNAFLYRNLDGRLIIVGDSTDLLSLLHWVEQNPLAQFRQIAAAKEDEPHHLFAHLFNEQGEVA